MSVVYNVLLRYMISTHGAQDKNILVHELWRSNGGNLSNKVKEEVFEKKKMKEYSKIII